MAVVALPYIVFSTFLLFQIVLVQYSYSDVYHHKYARTVQSNYRALQIAKSLRIGTIRKHVILR